ncbi:hypothetical protein NIES19_38220 [Anabaena cylindrica PCC 7122]|nr:hypothetical protein NIES19_38220 [Anabaena cylindrica PCC 7122]
MNQDIQVLLSGLSMMRYGVEEFFHAEAQRRKEEEDKRRLRFYIGCDDISILLPISMVFPTSDLATFVLTLNL